MGFKRRQQPKTISEGFDEFLSLANGSESVHDKVFLTAKVASAYAEGAPVEELTREQWESVYRAVFAARQFCDVILPDIMIKVRISETISWMKP